MGDAIAIIGVAMLVFAIGHCNNTQNDVRNRHRIECIKVCKDRPKGCISTCIGDGTTEEYEYEKKD